jgi:hypothetical protein
VLDGRNDDLDPETPRSQGFLNQLVGEFPDILAVVDSAFGCGEEPDGQSLRMELMPSTRFEEPSIPGNFTSNSA